MRDHAADAKVFKAFCDANRLQILELLRSGAGICFCVYAFNVQPGVQINYATGESALADAAPPEPTIQAPPEEEPSYVLNHNTRKFHRPSCSSVEDIKPSNREDYGGSREALIEQGYVPCKRCRP